MDVNSEKIAQVRNSNTEIFHESPKRWDRGTPDYHNFAGKDSNILSSIDFELPTGSSYPAYMDSSFHYSVMFRFEETPHTFR